MNATSDLLERVAAEDPCPTEVPGPDAAARIDAALERLLLAEPVAPRRPARGRHARLALAGAATLGLTVAVGLPGGGGVATTQLSTASAATVLADLGERAAHEPAASGRYAYLRTLSYVTHMQPRADGGTTAVVFPHDDETWLDRDGDGVHRTRIDTSAPRFPTPEDRRAFEAEGRPLATSLPPMGIRDQRTVGLRARELAALPTDPAALRRRLAEARRAAGDPSLVATVGTLLRTPLTPPKVRRALFELLRGLPDATVVPEVRDPLGRTGVGVRFDDAAWRTLFVFDRQTGALRATRSEGKREVPGRTTSDWSLVTASGWRDEAPAASPPAADGRRGPTPVTRAAS
ncbi:CU044_5270 family protein [Patulibacter defluvii]|uniref:CU044_5270 family protein n=1 Tax=Patulibacter defluvii TaxID=3095358 RepID=UPI002A74D34B|nr:CU044_5270 family protein [Patulibacter sp. DM4]